MQLGKPLVRNLEIENPEADKTRFLLYIDILGFSEMTQSDPRKVARAYAIIDEFVTDDNPLIKVIVFQTRYLYTIKTKRKMKKKKKFIYFL